MLGFGCSHKWRKYGGKYHGTQQHKCSRCGRLKNKGVRNPRHCRHQWRLDRRRKVVTLMCRKCGATQAVELHPAGWEPEPAESDTE